MRTVKQFVQRTTGKFQIQLVDLLANIFEKSFIIHL